MTLRSSKSTDPAGMAVLPVPANNLSAAGNAQGNATAIPAGQDLSIFTTVTAGQGARLPGSGVSFVPPEEYTVINHGANALLAYPASGHQCGTLGANVGVSIGAGKACLFWYVGPGQWAYCNGA